MVESVVSVEAVMSVELTLDDIADVRAYERERIEFRSHVIALKKLRRIHVGDFQTLVFENRDTIRFQIQEMARAEKILSDEGIAAELLTYNPLISRPGKLSATLFLELTSKDQLREWLAKLVGIEHSYELRIGAGENEEIVRGAVDCDHEAQLTREEMTASVHYLWFPVTAEQAARLEAGPATLACTHPAYPRQTLLTDENRRSLAAELLS